MKGKALLFGLNYAHCKAGKLNGCINDVYNISKFIERNYNIPQYIYTDDVDMKNTSYDGIVKNLYNLAIESYKENLDFVWIHYSGHGSNQKDTSGDEKDGMDEGLVPSDYEYKGILIDDIINNVMSSFNPKTKILFICDACHSGSILDLKYSWDTNKKSTIDNYNCKIKANTILISGCMDTQTSADAFNVLGDNKSVGALSACILKVLNNKPKYINDVFSFINAVRIELKKGRFEQYPCLSSTYDLVNNPMMIFSEEKVQEQNTTKPNKNENQVYYNIPHQQQYAQQHNQYMYQNQYKPQHYYETNNSYGYYPYQMNTYKSISHQLPMYNNHLVYYHM